MSEKHPSKLMEFIYKRKVLLILLIVILISFVIRYYRIIDTTGWEGDQARDYLVGYHIAKYNEFPTVGHAATGNSFYYPPYYYYLIAALIKIYESPFFIIGFFSLMNLISIITIYFIGKEINRSLTGLIASVSFAFSNLGVNAGRNIFAMNLATNIFLISFYFLTIFYKKNKPSNLLWSMIFLSITSVISYTGLIFFPLYLFWSLLTNSKAKVITLTHALVINAVFLSILFYPLVNYFGIKRFLLALSPFQNISLNTSNLLNITTNIKIFLNMLFGEININLGIIFLLLPILYLFFHRRNKILESTLFLTSFILEVLVLSSLKQSDTPSHYFNLIFLIYLIIVAVFFTEIFFQAKGRIFKTLINILIFIVFLIYISHKFSYFKYDYKSYKKSENTAESIIKQLKRIREENNLSTFNFFQTHIQTPIWPGWDNATIWYFLEKKLEYKMVKVINEGLNLEPVTTDNFIFLICRNFNEDDLDRVCISEFSYALSTHKLVYSVKNLSEDKIFLFKKFD